ncbi:hypothetical protein QBC46DRAFT_433937, partial [Diplogelasinospora grovesii]
FIAKQFEENDIFILISTLSLIPRIAAGQLQKQPRVQKNCFPPVDTFEMSSRDRSSGEGSGPKRTRIAIPVQSEEWEPDLPPQEWERRLRPPQGERIPPRRWEPGRPEAHEAVPDRKWDPNPDEEESSDWSAYGPGSDGGGYGSGGEGSGGGGLEKQPSKSQSSKSSKSSKSQPSKSQPHQPSGQGKKQKQPKPQPQKPAPKGKEERKK